MREGERKGKKRKRKEKGWGKSNRRRGLQSQKRRAAKDGNDYSPSYLKISKIAIKFEVSQMVFFSLINNMAVFFSRLRRSLGFGEAVKGVFVFHCFFFVMVVHGMPEMKAESVNPIPTFSPPEGNNTFLQGTSWCVALPGVSQVDLQNALDWACGQGMADCNPLQPGQPCSLPNTLLAHASYAFNSYYQQNGNSPIACNFGGTATITTRDPSYGSCIFPTAGGKPSSSTRLAAKRRLLLMQILGILLFFYVQ